jgi:selenoprotein W-related protein
LAAELLEAFEAEIETLSLVPSDGGRYEVSANGRTIYSKLETHRHAEPGEVVRNFRRLFPEISF